MQVTQTLTSDISGLPCLGRWTIQKPGQVDHPEAAPHHCSQTWAAWPMQGSPLEQQRALPIQFNHCPSLQVDHPEAATHPCQCGLFRLQWHVLQRKHAWHYLSGGAATAPWSIGLCSCIDMPCKEASSRIVLQMHLVPRPLCSTASASYAGLKSHPVSSLCPACRRTPRCGWGLSTPRLLSLTSMATCTTSPGQAAQLDTGALCSCRTFCLEQSLDVALWPPQSCCVCDAGITCATRCTAMWR